MLSNTLAYSIYLFFIHCRYSLIKIKILYLHTEIIIIILTMFTNKIFRQIKLY